MAAELAPDCFASSSTSPASTANPRPASRARADSMVASRASRFVWSAICRITFTRSGGAHGRPLAPTR